MDDPRQRYGNHTWDIVIEYCQCPYCGYIMEDRQKYEYRLGKYQKEVTCDRCKKTVTLTKKTRPTFGPIWGSL